MNCTMTKNQLAAVVGAQARRIERLKAALRCYVGSANSSAAEQALDEIETVQFPAAMGKTGRILPDVLMARPETTDDTRMIDWIEKHKAIPLPGNDSESHAWQWVGSVTFRERVKQAMGPAEWGKG